MLYGVGVFSFSQLLCDAGWLVCIDWRVIILPMAFDQGHKGPRTADLIVCAKGGANYADYVLHLVDLYAHSCGRTTALKPVKPPPFVDENGERLVYCME